MTTVGNFMTIRAGQIAALQEDLEQRRVEELLEHLQERYWVFDEYDHDVAVDMIRRGVRKARRYSLVGQENITGFLELMCEIGPDFDRHPAFQTILTDDVLDPHERILALITSIDDEDLADAEEQSDPAAWFSDAG